jgi:adenylate kinase family enzyme
MDMNTINKRLDTFEKETMPVIKYFDSIWKLITVRADVSVMKSIKLWLRSCECNVF